MVTHNKTISRLLSLVLCLCMVLTLLPMIPMEAEAASATTLYLKPNSNWTQANARFAAYFFGNGEKWVSMTDSNKDGIYEVVAPSGYPSVIFCRMNPNASGNGWNNKWDQTNDLTVPTNGTNCYIVKAGAWSNGAGSWDKLCYHTFSGNTCSKCSAVGVTIYFQNNWLWSDVSLYYWFGTDNALYNKPHPGEAMTYYGNDGTNDYYFVTIPIGVKGIQFNGIKDDGSGIRDQVDITSGWKNNLCYRMLSVNYSNTVETFDISTVKFPCKHKNVVDVAGTDATCTATGLTAGTKCADCGEPVKAQTVIPALGHKWSDATCDAPKTCSVCKTTEGAALGHSYKNDCDATCDICGDIREVGEHLYVFGCDTICYMCDEVTRPDAAHVSNMYPCCDGVCQYGCGKQMPATGEHVYDNACDFECNVCYGHREVPDHVYDNACDAECNICGDARWVPAHNYDGDCDTDCNICGDVREPGEHLYIHSCDTKCFVCGKLTRPGATHLSDYPCKAGACLFGCGTEVPASSDHNWNCYYEQAPNCGFDGAYYYQCLSCGDRYEEYPTATGEHTYANNCDTNCFVCGKLTRPKAVHVSNTPSCKEGVCLYCGIVTPATEEHSDNSEVTEPDCENEGYTTHTCSVCGNSYVSEYTEALGHKYEATEYVWAEGYSNCTASRTCGVCGEAEYETLEALVFEEVPATCQEPAVLGYSALFIGVSWAEAQTVTMVDPAGALNPDNHVSDTMIYLDNGNGTHNEQWSCCGAAATVEVPHADADENGRCDDCQGLMAPAQLRKVSVSLKGNIAVNYYMLLSEEVLADDTAYMYFKLVDGELTIPVSKGVPMELEGETYYVYTCAVDAKEMTDTITSQFFYGDNVTKEHTYSVQTYGKHILASYDDQDTKDLIVSMLNYGAASQLHFGYNTDVLANDIRDDLGNALIAAPDYSDMTIEGFNAVAGQGTALAKFYSASLILKSETTVRFFFQVDSAADFTASYKDQELTVSKRGSLYYVDVVGISAKDLDEAVVITVNDGTNSADVSFNPMSYCQGVLNDTTGAFTAEMQDLVCALYLYNQAANVYFKEV